MIALLINNIQKRKSLTDPTKFQINLKLSSKVFKMASALYFKQIYNVYSYDQSFTLLYQSLKKYTIF